MRGPSLTSTGNSSKQKDGEDVLSRRQVELHAKIRDINLNNLGQKSETAVCSSCGLA